MGYKALGFVRIVYGNVVYGYRVNIRPQIRAAFSTACQKTRSLCLSENLLSIEVTVEIRYKITSKLTSKFMRFLGLV